MYNSEKSAADINYDHYHFSVGTKYDLKTRDLTYKKMKYIYDEVFLSLHLRMWRTIQYQMMVLIIIMLYFYRMFVHYTGQYCLLTAMQVPIVKFEFHWAVIVLEYAPNHFYQEALCSVIGATANTIGFFFNFMVAYGMKRVFDWYPRFYHNIICWMGIYAVLDPFITLFLDFVTENFEWGDYFIFYNFFKGSSHGEGGES
jgi:hypothetical protein